MTTISTVEAREQFSEIVNRAAYSKERVILTRRGKALAAIVPIEDVKLIEEMEDRRDLKKARAALAEAREKGSVPLDKVIADLELA
jgi:prevent-host-death family protein